jgi:threonine dehydrogenase-like Zn-dependent dehydrogenase
MAVLGAIEYGAEKVYAIDTVAERLDRAKQFGAIPINASAENTLEIIKVANEGRGADAVLEAVGNSSTNKLAYDLVRPGGIISAVGVCTDQHLAFSPTQAYDKNLTYKVGRCPARSMMNELVPMVQSKKHDFTSIITHRLSLSEGALGYDIFANKKDNCLKVMLKP